VHACPRATTQGQRQFRPDRLRATIWGRIVTEHASAPDFPGVEAERIRGASTVALRRDRGGPRSAIALPSAGRRRPSTYEILWRGGRIRSPCCQSASRRDGAPAFLFLVGSVRRLAVSATLFRARGTHAVPTRCRPRRDLTAAHRLARRRPTG
jgi:hypothetical protein